MFGIPCNIHNMKIEATDNYKDPGNEACYPELFVPSGMSCFITYLPGGIAAYLHVT